MACSGAPVELLHRNYRGVNPVLRVAACLASKNPMLIMSKEATI